jgi:predicted RNA methylase
MSIENNRHQLRTITETLLSPGSNYNTIRMATHALKDIFCNAVGFDEIEAAKQAHIQTGGGQAISTYTAALCITDMMRTRKFLLGIKEAVEERLKANTGKPVTILYAGSGPFATLLTPLTTIFTPDQLQMVLLEINPVSIGYLQKTVEQFGLEKYVIGIEQTDAVHYTIPGKYQPDILLSETMKPALQKEPQVSIVANLLPQCKSNTVLIPSNIIVEACLLGNLAGDPLSIQPLQVLFDLCTSTLQDIKAEKAIATGIVVELEVDPSPDYTRIVLSTIVQVYGEHSIRLQESGITLVEPLLDITAIKKYPARLLFRYRMNEKPGFEAEIL